MRSFTGIQTNINQPIVCKVLSIYNDSTDGLRARTLISEKSDPKKRHCILLSSISKPPTSDEELFFQLEKEDIVMNVGDILLLEPNNQVIVLFEAHSFSNALLLTEKCNCKCLMCPQPPRPDTNDDIELSLETISLLNKETKVLAITGGEPTLAWDGLIEVLSSCQMFIPETSIELLTNARVLKSFNKAQELAASGGKKLSACVPLYADVATIHDDIVNARGAFWETIEGIYNLERVQVPVELRIVIIKQNYKRLTQWSEFVYRAFPFAIHIAIMGMEPEGLAAKNLATVWVDPIDYSPMLEKAVNILNQRNMNVSIYNHQLCTLPSSLWRFTQKSISEWKNIFLSECQGCTAMSSCGGFFQSSEKMRSKGIRSITLGTPDSITLP